MYVPTRRHARRFSFLVAASVADDRRSTDSGRSGTVELLLAGPDGAPWRLTVSAGIERFIGAYQRLPGLDPLGDPSQSGSFADPPAEG